jgi:hypothetical protein
MLAGKFRAYRPGGKGTRTQHAPSAHFFGKEMKASNFATIRNDSDLFAQDKLFEKSFEEVAMKNASRYRALASLCRQQAAYKPDQSWHLLGQAERWEHLAEAELADHFKECNGDNCSNDSDKAKAA